MSPSLAAALLAETAFRMRRVGFSLLFLATGLVLVPLGAGPLFAFENTGNLVTPRDEHKAVLLPNGKVLIAGGRNTAGNAIASAELYDPASGTWTTTGSLGTTRFSHTMTLLANGKVLVAGGFHATTRASAELYDPATGVWTPTGNLNTARLDHTATLLPNGKVLVAGGSFTPGSPDIPSAELYDPATGLWTVTGSLGVRRYGHTETLLPNGKVLVAGGFASNRASAELYDPASGSWTATGNLTVERALHKAVLLPNGKVLVAGGRGPSFEAIATAELYDPASGSWMATGSLAARRYGHTMTLLANGKVLSAGGFNDEYLASAELYDSATGLWTTTGTLATARNRPTATLLPDSKVLFAGGSPGSANASAELYDPPTAVAYSENPASYTKGQVIANNVPTTSGGPVSDYSVSPNLPAGLSLNSTTGVISGTPTAGAATAQYTITAANSSGSASIALTITVVDNDPPPTPSPPQVLNISTRSRVETGDNILIGGVIVTGNASKSVIIRAIGPSLLGAGVPSALPDPTLELHDAASNVIAFNDNWQDLQKQQIQDSGLAPKNDLEAAIVIRLNPNSNYTAIVRGKGGLVGIALVEVYDLEQGADSGLANISSRAFVQVNDNVLIAGFILGGTISNPAKLVLRGLGPSLADLGVPNFLQDPTMVVYDANGNGVGANDNWKDGQQPQIGMAGLAPKDDRESALYLELAPGNYTAIVSGKNGATGVALVEGYNLP